MAGPSVPLGAVPRSRCCLSPVLPHRRVWSCCPCSIHSRKGKNFRDQSLRAAGMVCSSCQGWRCSTGRGTCSILGSWERQQEAGAGRGARAQPGTRGCARVGCSQHTQAAQAVPGRGDSQENALRAGMARAVLPALPGRLLPAQPSSSWALPPCAAAGAGGNSLGKQHIPVGWQGAGKGTAAVSAWSIPSCALLKVPSLRHPSWLWPGCSWERRDW